MDTKNFDSRLLSSAQTPEEEDLLKDMMAKRDAAKDLFVMTENEWKDIRNNAEEDIKFYTGKTIDSSVLLAGQTKAEPMLSTNQLPQFVKQIENQLRELDISIAVSPTDEEGSEDIADIYNGLIRCIQNDSRASMHYVHVAGESGALVPGMGFLRVDIEDVNKKAFTGHQKLVIGSVFDPFSILPDFNSHAVDYSDAEYWFEINDYPVSTYKQEFPYSEMATLDITTVGINLDAWAQSEGNRQKSIRVLRYWYKETVDYYQYQLEDGSVIDSMKYNKPEEDPEDNEEMTGKLPFPTDEKTGEKKIVNRKRHTMKTTIKWLDMNGVEILREGTWPGELFPFVAVIGPQMVINGRRDIRGIIRYAKDAQKMLNYMVSSIARRIGSANKAPWVADKKSIAPYQKQWQTANTENWSVLMYDAYRDNPAAAGELLQNPAPQRADQTSQITDLMQAVQLWEDRLKATIGLYDAGLGATPNEQSGVAILTLAQQGQNNNLHFSENLVVAIEHLGAILIDLIPKVYDSARTIRIVNPDSTEELVKINQMFQKGNTTKNYDLSQGSYSVKVNSGPAFATRKQAALDQLLEITRVDPQLLPVLQDLMVGSMDFSTAHVAKERLTKLFAQQFPQLQDNDESETIPPKAQAALAQQGQMIQKLTQELTMLHQEYEKAQFQLKADTVQNAGKIHLENLQFEHEKSLEELRTKRDMIDNAAKLQQEEVKIRLSHVEKMHQVLMPHLTKEGEPKSDAAE